MVRPNSPEQVAPRDVSARRRNYRPMTTSDEVRFAWALATVTESVLTSQERTWLCVTLGAGDSAQAVEELLTVIADRGIALTDDLVDSAADWLGGFAGTTAEPRLKSLVAGLTIKHPQ